MTGSSSRQAILDRIRLGIRNDENRYDAVPRNYIHRGSLDSDGRIHLMAERLREYGAEVLESSPAELPKTIARHIQSRGRDHIVVPPKRPAGWLGNGIDWKLDNDLSYEEIEHCGGVITPLATQCELERTRS